MKFSVDKARFEINLAEVCKDVINKYTYYDVQKKRTVTDKEHVFYPVSKAKKLFRLMIQNIYDEEQIDSIESFLKENNTKLYQVFRKERYGNK